jgi:hypothetical protein
MDPGPVLQWKFSRYGMSYERGSDVPGMETHDGEVRFHQ